MGLTLFQSVFAFILNLSGLVLGVLFYALMRYLGQINYSNVNNGSKDGSPSQSEVNDEVHNTLTEKLLLPEVDDMTR